MSKKNLTIDWDPKFGVEVEEVDNYQKSLFDQFNELIDLKQKKTDPKIIANMISEINDAGKLFFSSEEKLLKKRKYPDFDAHVRQHRHFIKTSINMRREIAEDVENLTLEAIVDLRDWMVEHIETSDCEYKPFLRIHQYIDDVTKKK